jgi:hypothetical protein
MTDDKRTAIAAFILETAGSAGIAVGTDGAVLTGIKPPMPWRIWQPFEDALFEYQDEIIELLLAGREGEGGK